MGRQERERKEKSKLSLREAAQTDPSLFEQLWNERLNTFASEIWRGQREQARFTYKEYDSFISQYPKAKTILEDLLTYTKQGCFIYLDKLNDFLKDELGADAVAELTRRVKQGGLRGEKAFKIANRAQKMLATCGERAVALQQEETAAVLENECCRALATNIGVEIYTLSKYRKPEEKEARNGRRLKFTSRR